MPRLPEDQIIERIIAQLKYLGCPDIRNGEGSDEWEHKKGSYRFTPDLVAGPLLGDGNYFDFYIDVFSPKGDQFIKPQAGSPTAAKVVTEAIENEGSFNLKDLGREYSPFYGPINKKIEKYSTSRCNSPLFGLATYFCISSNSYIGPLLARLHYIRALDDAFGITTSPNGEAKKKALNSLIGESASRLVLIHNLKLNISFIFIHIDRLLNKGCIEKSLLLINSSILASNSLWAHNIVIQWLTKLATKS